MVYMVMAEKKTPHHDLDAIKVAFSTGKGHFTWTATQDAAALGYDSDEMTAIIQTVVKSHFYKSMTSNYDASIWQDVYHAPHEEGTLYVKFTDNGTVTEFTLLSFKEK
jgi:motility quorum-sensing regulator / GCU-specific mRNA interferase toxin